MIIERIDEAHYINHYRECSILYSYKETAAVYIRHNTTICTQYYTHELEGSTLYTKEGYSRLSTYKQISKCTVMLYCCNIAIHNNVFRALVDHVKGYTSNTSAPGVCSIATMMLYTLDVSQIESIAHRLAKYEIVPQGCYDGVYYEFIDGSAIVGVDSLFRLVEGEDKQMIRSQYLC